MGKKTKDSEKSQLAMNNRISTTISDIDVLFLKGAIANLYDSNDGCLSPNRCHCLHNSGVY